MPTAENVEFVDDIGPETRQGEANRQDKPRGEYPGGEEPELREMNKWR